MRLPCRRKFGLMGAVLVGAVALGARSVRAEPPAPPSGIEIQQELKAFATTGRVLMIAAHPDDENTNLITYLARGRGYQMGYLSVTRGDGGQNVLGGEFGAELGYIRTNELLAARSLDHGVQFFTRALDFGFSKNPDETLRIWDREQVLADVVRVIRNFRPDVVVTRFAPDQTNTHGHHTASAILGLAAFKVAGDQRVLPEVPAWQPKRIFVNAGGGARGSGAGGVRIESGGTDPVLNLTYGQIAAQSRAMHKSQGLGNAAAGAGRGGPGGAGGGNPQESFTLLDGEPATKDIMDGVDTTLARLGKGGDEMTKLAAEAIAEFDAKRPDASVPTLLKIQNLIAALMTARANFTPDPLVLEKRRQIDHIIADCLGLSYETTVVSADVSPGDGLALDMTARVTSDIPVRWIQDQLPPGGGPEDFGSRPAPTPIDLKARQAAMRHENRILAANTPISQPYWLKHEPKAGIFVVDDAAMIGRPMNPPAYPIEHLFQVAGQTLYLEDQPVELLPNAPVAQQRRPLEVVAPVSLSFPSEVRLFAPGVDKTVEVQVEAHRANVSGTVKLDAPAGWVIQTFPQAFKFEKAGDHATFQFNVTPPKDGVATLTAAATVGSQTYSVGRKELKADVYEHLPRLLLQPPATIKAVSLDLKIKGKTIGYLPGAGDSVDQCLEQMGYAVKPLKAADLTAEGLKGLDAVVIGVRAFNTRDDLSPNGAALKAIFDYAEAGGTVVEQYSRPDGPGGTNGRPTALAPYNIHLSALRVTDENAKVSFLVPVSPVLNTPNKITEKDFEGWVQERNIYLPDQVDSHFAQILGMADPGETPPNTSLLVAQHGKGYFVYTSLVFFRELPAGNAGAYRLFANLVSLGKP